MKTIGQGTEFNVPISVRIRLLEPYEKLVETLVKAGIEHLCVPHLSTGTGNPGPSNYHGDHRDLQGGRGWDPRQWRY